MLRALCPLAVLLYALPAAAQVTDDRIKSEVTPTTLTISDCSGKELSYTASVLVLPQETDSNSGWVLEFGNSCGSGAPAATYEDCGPDVESCCERLKDGSMPQPSAAGGETLELSATVDVDDVIDCSADPKNSVEFVLKLNVLKFENSLPTGDNEYISKAEQVSLSLTRPDPPDRPEVSAGETTVDVDWEGEGDHKACAVRGEFDLDKPLSDQDGVDKTCSSKDNDGSVKITGLEKGIAYQVVLISFDSDGNESFPSRSTNVTTEEVTDFYEMYRREYGGGDPGGYCATTPGAGAAGGAAGGFGLLCFVGLGLALRRRGRILGALTAAGLLLVAAPAFAESPKFMTFEFRVGNWLPNVDAEFENHDGAGPYKTVFGEDSATVVDLEFAAHVYQGYGTASVGLGLGRGSVNGKGVDTDGTKSTESTSLALFPLSLFGAYAFDWPAERWGFPIVPYGKLGLDWVLWEISDGSGETATVSGDEDGADGSGEGGTVGWHYALGARLLLDALAPEMARTFDLDMGVNNSYVFFEWFNATVDDFGDENALRMGAEVFFWGLAFDF